MGVEGYTVGMASNRVKKDGIGAGVIHNLSISFTTANSLLLLRSPPSFLLPLLLTCQLHHHYLC